MDKSIKICFKTGIFVIVLLTLLIIFGITSIILYKKRLLVSKNIELENNLIKDIESATNQSVSNDLEVDQTSEIPDVL